MLLTMAAMRHNPVLGIMAVIDIGITVIGVVTFRG
jgi:hypothetical protein